MVFRRAGFLVVCITMLFSGCYYTKQGRYLFSHQLKAGSVERLLNRKDIPDETRDFLLLVQDIRRFSRDELGLKDNKNYTTFLDNGNDVLAYVVSACAPLSFESHQWKYPFMGKMPYKGFYEVDDARREGDRLKDMGLDVWIRGVDAFSTLGFLKDPLYAYMSDYPVHRLANLLIHEQTHATIWRKDDISFNEDLASFVGEEGARLYVLERYGEESPEYLRIEPEKDDYSHFVEDVFSLRDELQEYYSGISEDDGDQDLLSGKEKIITGFQERFRAGYDERYSSDRFLGFADLPVNNAYIDLFQLYEGDRAWFEQKYAEAGYDMKVFLASL